MYCRSQITADPFVENRGGKAPFTLEEMRLQERDDDRSVVRGQQTPDGLCAHALETCDGFVGFQLFVPDIWIFIT